MLQTLVDRNGAGAGLCDDTPEDDVSLYNEDSETSHTD